MHRWMILLAGAALAASAPLALGADPHFALVPKQVCAPPSDILSGIVRLPALGDVVEQSRSARLTVRLERAPDGTLSWSGAVPVDDGANVRMVLLTPDGVLLDWQVTPPPLPVQSIVRVNAEPPQVEHAVLEQFAATPNAEFRAFPIAGAGQWTLRVRATNPVVGDAPIDASLFVASDSPHVLRTSVDASNHIPGGSATITADIGSDPDAGEGATLTSAVVRIGDDTVEMLDDGLHNDGAAGDGRFGATIPLDRVGAVEARVEAVGVTQSGAPIFRTIDHRIEVAPGGVDIAPNGTEAVASLDAAADRAQIRLDISVAFADAHRRVLVAAEVWGHSPTTGDPIPAVWSAMVTEPRVLASGTVGASLFVDPRWLATSTVVGPFELRNVRAHDVDSFVAVAQREAVPVRIAGDLSLPAAAPRAADSAMTSGVRRPEFALAPTIDSDELDAALESGRAVGAHNLLLSHGYCAGGSPWPLANFSGYLEVFSDPNQNRTHDQFAQLLAAAGANSKSFGILGHSQGGDAALHLWTFYFTGLDWATGPRRIQSVGTPYQGTPLASLGGFSCGVNNDMTPAGAATWLSTIPMAQRAAVYYYTTQYTDFWCDFLANFVLGTPNDGVVEVARGQLPGGNNMGNTTGWCHTTGMSYPAHYTDASRNAILNANAAR